MKTFMMIALAAVSMSAFAQGMGEKKMGWQDKTWTADWSMKHGIELDKPIADQPKMQVGKAVKMHIDEYMTGGDQYMFSQLWDRTPSNVTWALKQGLANVLQQSLILQSGWNNSEMSNSGMAVKDIIVANKALGPDTYAMFESPQPMADSSRPMKMVTWMGAPNVMADSAWTWKAISANLNETQKAVLWGWYDNTTGSNRLLVSRFVQSAINSHALNYNSALRGNWW